MAWGLVDDNFHDHPKVVMAGAEAIGYWTRCLSYARDHRTGGFVPRGYVEQICGGARKAKAIAHALVEKCKLQPDGAGLWVEVEGGWRFHEYERRYRGKQAEEQLSQVRSEAGRKGASATHGKHGGNLPATGQPNERQNDGKSDGKNMATGPSPSPDPSPEDPELCVTSARARVDRKRLLEAYDRDWGITQMAIQPMALDEMCRRVEGWATKHDRDATETALASLPIMAEIAKRWTQPRPPLPHLIVGNWGDIEARLAGKIAPPPDRAARPSRPPEFVDPRKAEREASASDPPPGMLDELKRRLR